MGAELKIYNSRGEEVLLNAREKRIADINQRLCNAYGYEINITSLTTIVKEISEQKFFEIPPADFVPVVVGNGAFSEFLQTYRSFYIADDFATGVLSNGANQARLASADSAVDSVAVQIKSWAKQNDWTLIELQQASKAGNWELVTEKAKSRKKNWDLGIQKVAFLGLTGDSNVLGLFNQAGVTVDTTTLTQSITSLAGTPANLSTFIAAVLNVYRANCNRTAWPTHFIIPESDYLGLATPSSATYPIKSILQLMEETFQLMTRNKNFKILPCAYGDKAYSGLGYQQYALLNYDPASIRMDIPVDFTATMANSLNNFQFTNVAYGQFTGVVAYRQAELYYFHF